MLVYTIIKDYIDPRQLQELALDLSDSEILYPILLSSIMCLAGT